ncbi:MAG TPA: hypothetical protein VK390_12310 [Propionibacteriaceae bacterium]|nr:hypothetical protein [Propionibacteriaceae bacterium]
MAIPATPKALSFEFAARISRGDPLPGPATPPRAVIPMAAEDDLYDTIRHRIDAAGGEPRHFIAFSTFLSAGVPVGILNDFRVLEGMRVRRAPSPIPWSRFCRLGTT